MAERILIVGEMRTNRKNLINANTEVFGACRHRPKFHRYRPDDPKGEKGIAVKCTIILYPLCPIY